MLIHLTSYAEAYTTIRDISGISQGNGAFVSFHDGFAGTATWAGFLTGADRCNLDTHPYFAFDGSSAVIPIDTGTGPGAGGTWPQTACKAWGAELNTRFTVPSIPM